MHARDIPIPLDAAPIAEDSRAGAAYSFRRGAERGKASGILFIFLIGALVGGIGLLTMMIVRPDGRRSSMTHTMLAPTEASLALAPVTAVPPIAAIPSPVVVATPTAAVPSERTAKAHVVKRRAKPSTRPVSKNGPVQVN